MEVICEVRNLPHRRKRREPRKPTQKALQEMAKAMVYFLSIGWRKQDLDMLEEMWWQVRDDNGAVRNG